ncbi:hemerythrin domain-containing protein [Streptomyces globosus]|uniref:hemerythrin domain-containing protein n=1 Tax=Streptomyces globosus TaxID=68209 RepID=UPI0036423CFC
MNSERVTTAAPRGLRAVPDLTGLRLAHRAILADADRLAGLLADLAAGARPVSPERAAAIAAYLRRYNRAVRAHHRGEAEILWPLVLDAAADPAGAIADIVRFVDDHRALEALQTAADAAADGFATDPAHGAPELAALLARRRDLLIDHIRAEEEHLLPVITAQIPGAAYAAAEAAIARAGRPGTARAGEVDGDADWVRGWLLSHATAEEVRRLLRGRAGAGARAVAWPAVEPLVQGYRAEAEKVFAG